jgi:hypothetical protein
MLPPSGFGESGLREPFPWKTEAAGEIRDVDMDLENVPSLRPKTERSPRFRDRLGECPAVRGGWRQTAGGRSQSSGGSLGEKAGSLPWYIVALNTFCA